MAKTFISREEDGVLLFGFLLILALTAIAVVNVPQAHAAGITFSASTTVSLTGTGDTLTVAGGSTASTTAVGTTNMVINMQNGDAMTVSAASKSLAATGQSSDSILSNTLCYTNFGNGSGTIVITATQNEAITLTTAACGLYSPGGSAGEPQILPTYTDTPGTTGGGTSTPTPTPTPTPSAATPTSPDGFTVLPAAPTVTQIQLAISEVLQRIVQLQVNPTAPDILSQLQQLVYRIAYIQQAVTGEARASSGASGNCNFTRSLTVGSTGEDVRCLQQYLNSAGFTVAVSGGGSLGQETTYFGARTRAALAKWQAANGVSPAVGYFGPISRAKYNELLGF